MRGELQNPPPIANSAHASTYSTFHDDGEKDSATMCGTCHDIDSPAGGHIERTFAEWSASAYSGPGGLTCTSSGCHMTRPPAEIPIAKGGPNRVFHPHKFPGVHVSRTTSLPGVDGGDTADGAIASGGDPTRGRRDSERRGSSRRRRDCERRRSGRGRIGREHPPRHDRCAERAQQRRAAGRALRHRQ